MKYEYKVELVNHRNPKLAMIKESISEFAPKDCWGYPKFIYIEDLYKDGYINEEEKLVLKFYIRAPLYAQHVKDQRNYIKELEEKLKAMESDIEKCKKLDNNKQETKEILPKNTSLEDVIKNVKIENVEEVKNEEDSLNKAEEVILKEIKDSQNKCYSKQKNNIAAKKSSVSLRGSPEKKDSSRTQINKSHVIDDYNNLDDIKLKENDQ